MNIIDEFVRMVQIDAASGNERGVADAIIARLEELGCEVWEDGSVKEKLGGNAGNVYAVLPGTKDGSVLFSSHMDRVANGLGIRPLIQSDRIVSQGTILAADDLSGVAAILDGLQRIKDSGAEHARIELIFSVYEEKGVSGSKHFDYSRFRSKYAYVFDSPGRIGRVINSAPSKSQIDIAVTGRAAHAGNAPEKGINAVMAGAKIISRLPDGRLDEESTANYSTFEASGPTNVVNDHAAIRGEARSRDHSKLLSYLEKVRNVCDEVAAETGAEIDLKTDINYEGFRVSSDSAPIRKLKEVFDEMGIEMRVEEGGGGMDANRLNANGIVSVGVATGYLSNHTSKEHIFIEDLKLAGELVERLMLMA